MSVVRAIAIVAGCGMFFGTAGGLLGFILGSFAPDYYRGVFNAVDKAEFYPIQVGVGLGLSQGLIGGLIIECVVIMVVAVSKQRPQDRT